MSVVVYKHPEDADAIRCDKALSSFLSGQFSRSRLERCFDEGKVKLRGEPLIKKNILNGGDEVEIELPEQIETLVNPVDIPVPIIYEDSDVVVVNKPSGMTVHPGSGTGEDTLVHAMLYHCKGKLSMAGGANRPGIVHRLDKETSGLMILAKTDKAYYSLIESFSGREVEKTYLTLVCGVPNVRTGSIQKSIGRHPSFRTKMCITESESGRFAHTDWEMLENYGADASLLLCRIHTGRTHQIRVHMTSIGYPILGDYTYCFQKNKMKKIKPPERVMLHSYSLKMDHPTKKNKIIDLKAEPPKDFRDLILELKDTTNG